MNTENQNTPLLKYRLYDFSRPHGHEASPQSALLTNREAIVKNIAFSTNNTQKKYIKER
jgi:hypothetical protein